MRDDLPYRIWRHLDDDAAADDLIDRYRDSGAYSDDALEAHPDHEALAIAAYEGTEAEHDAAQAWETDLMEAARDSARLTTDPDTWPNGAA